MALRYIYNSDSGLNVGMTQGCTMLRTYLSSIGSFVGWSRGRRLVIGAAMMPMSWSATVPTHAAATDCKSDAAGITLPNGFCATIFADNVGHARQMAVAPDGARAKSFFVKRL